MEKILRIFLVLLAFSLSANAATRGDIKVIEASENIRYLSQKMVKDYLFLYHYPEQADVKRKLSAELSLLGDDLRIIAATTKDTDSKDILEFLAYSKDQIAEIFEEKADKESAALMLDYSETLLEGADSIAASHTYAFTQEEKMLMLTHSISQHLEGIVKYYVAYHNNKTDPEILKKLHREIKAFNDAFSQIQQYKYADPKIAAKRERIHATWQTIEPYLASVKHDSSLPIIISLAVEHMNALLLAS